MNVLVVVPARGGSKGIPHKNIRPCGGKPLLAWSIEAALASRFVQEAGMVVVSSDDLNILDAAQRVSPRVIVQQRPSALATDTATTDSVICHVLRSISFAPDIVVLLQPTVPIRRPGLVDECIQKLLDTRADSVLTAYPLHFVWWRETPEPGANAAAPAGPWRSQVWRTLNKAGRLFDLFRPRRQDMHAREVMFHEDGSVYVSRAELLRLVGSRLGGAIEVVETRRTPDIDTEEDLALADAMLRARPEQEAIAC